MKNLDKIKGCLVGGAVGDALGYPVEFLTDSQIFRRYGERGITDYDKRDGIAEISDDTQMTLFTATALLYGKTRAMTHGTYSPLLYMNGSYINWYMTQHSGVNFGDERIFSWLMNERRMFSQRAPGNTCLSAIKRSMQTGERFSTENPANNSKGCGGIMRVAPIGVYLQNHDEYEHRVEMLGAEAAALTHGHPLGYIPAAALVHIISRVANEENITIRKAVESSVVVVSELFKGSEYLDDFIALTNRAMELAQQTDIDELDAIRELGEGWVAEETFAISIYCTLRHPDSFENAIIAAVNHSGDSDSTGAVTGNIMGAYLGFGAIPEKYLLDLELIDIITEIAEDMYNDCQMTSLDPYYDPVWDEKYITMTYKTSTADK